MWQTEKACCQQLNPRRKANKSARHPFSQIRVASSDPTAPLFHRNFGDHGAKLDRKRTSLFFGVGMPLGSDK
jgi:hypothetical protein